MNVRLYTFQRLTALLMVPLIVGHLIVIFYATRNGLTASEILGRTRGSVLWGLYYATFVLAASVHGAIGVRAVLREWGPRRLAHDPRALDIAMWAFGVVLVVLGLRAVAAVVM
ncbi:MAG: succinate dehydrogenase [Hyphomicrobiaceae bacterium]